MALGIGLATIIPDNGVTAIKVGDVDGVKLAGLLVDAGSRWTSRR
ncbi:Exo-beta-1,3-glucanase [Streptomyces californicus]